MTRARIDAGKLGRARLHIVYFGGATGFQDGTAVSWMRGRKPQLAAHDGPQVCGDKRGVGRLAQVEVDGAVRLHTVFALTGSERDWPLRRISCLDPERGAVDGWSYPRHRIPEEHVGS